MSLHRKLLLVIADAEHARFVRPVDADNTLHSYSRVRIADGHRGAAHHAHEDDKDKFPVWVAAQLNDATATYDALVLVAPAHRLNILRDHLTGAASAKIVGTLDKDLVRVPDEELWPHVREWVRPVHREALL